MLTSPVARAKADQVKARIAAGNIGYQARMIAAETHADRIAVATAADRDQRDLWAVAHAHEAKLATIRDTVMDALRAGTPMAATRALNSIEALLRGMT